MLGVKFRCLGVSVLSVLGGSCNFLGVLVCFCSFSSNSKTGIHTFLSGFADVLQM